MIDPKLINDGIWQINSTEKTRGNKRKTIVIVGIERSGTSMIARVVKNMGVYLGESHNDAVFEDVQIANALEKKDIRAFRKIVRKNNEKHDLWGWKRPKAFTYKERYIGTIENPHFIITFRDILAIAKRNELSVNAALLKSLKQAAEKYIDLCKFVENLKHPALCISYEKAIMNNDSLINSISKFIGVGIDESKSLSHLIENGRAEYLINSTNKLNDENRRSKDILNGKCSYLGKVDEVRPNLIRGWIKCKKNDKPVSLIVKHNGEAISEIKADLFRPDLLEHKLGNGKHAFKLELPKGVLSKNIGLMVKNTDFYLLTE